MKPKLYLQKYNEVFLHLSGDPGILQEISETFTFEMKNFSYHPKVRMKRGNGQRRWDGKIRLFDKRLGLIYFGLKSKIIDLCKDRGYEAVVSESADEPETTLTAIALKKYVESLNLPFEIREYQLDALANMLRRGRSLIVSPTGSGKSFIMYCAIRAYLTSGLKGVLIVPTQGLVEQMYKDFQDYSTKNKWDVSEHVQKLYHGYDPLFTSDLLITTWQSLITLDPEYLSQFQFVIGDECHQWDAKSFAKIGKQLVCAKYRTGFTGTLEDSKPHELTLEGLFGPIYHGETTAELIKQGYLADLHIKCILFKHAADVSFQFTGSDYQSEIEYITQNEKRNNFIAELAASLKGNTLVLFNFVGNQGTKLHDRLLQLAPGRVHFIHGQIEADGREEIRSILNNGKNEILCASLGTFSLGANVPNLHNSIWAHPSKSKIRNLQSLGRGLRIGENKDSHVLYDIADDMSYNGKMNYTLEHFAERLRIYDAEKFDYKIYKLDF